MKKLVLLLLLLMARPAFSQDLAFTAPDYKSIQKNIEDKNSKFYYPNLLKRLKENDTLLSKEEFQHLYFGYTFQKTYDPYWRGAYDKDLAKLTENGKIDAKDYDAILKLCLKSLDSFPFDLRNLDLLIYIYHMKGDTAAVKKASHTIGGIADAIITSGDGKTCETGYHVIIVGHEYFLLNIWELESQSQSLINNCDYLAFEKGKYKLDGMYFNIEKMMEAEMKAIQGK